MREGDHLAVLLGERREGALEPLERSESPVELAFAAGLAAACAVDAAESPVLDGEQRAAIAAEGRARSLALLRGALEKGLCDRSLLEQDRRLVSLRDEPGFREVFEALSAKE